MKKIIAAVLVTIALSIAPMLPASASLPACPATATIESIENGCELPAYPEGARPIVGYLFSVIDLVVNHYAPLVYDLQRQVKTQKEMISRKQARIERLREKIGRRAVLSVL